jgi:CARDB protein
MFRHTVPARLAAVAAAAALSAGALTPVASAATRPPVANVTAGSLLNPSLFKANLTATQSAGVVTIKNTGVVASGAFTIGIYRATSSAKVRVANLAPGASVRVSPGTDGGIVRADIFDEVDERNENDNAVYARLQS